MSKDNSDKDEIERETSETLKSLFEMVRELSKSESETARELDELEDYARSMADVLTEHHEKIERLEETHPSGRLSDDSRAFCIKIGKLRNAGKVGEALDYARQKRDTLSKDPDYWTCVGHLCINKKDYMGAVTAFEQANTLENHTAEPLLQLAGIRAVTGQWAEALHDLRMFVQQYPVCFDDRFALLARLVLSKCESANTVKLTIEDIQCTEPEHTQFLKAYLYYTVGSFGEAQVCLQEYSGSAEVGKLLAALIAARTGDKKPFYSLMKSLRLDFSVDSISSHLLVDSISLFDGQDCKVFERFATDAANKLDWSHHSISYTTFIEAAAKQIFDIMCMDIEYMIPLVEAAQRYTDSMNVQVIHVIALLDVGRLKDSLQVLKRALKNRPDEMTLRYLSVMLYALNNQMRKTETELMHLLSDEKALEDYEMMESLIQIVAGTGVPHFDDAVRAFLDMCKRVRPEKVAQAQAFVNKIQNSSA